MPIIYTYPIKSTANDNDLILISDSQDSNKTKQIKIGDLPGGSSSGVSSVTATLPVVSSGGNTPVISLKDLTGFGTAGQVIKVNSGADGLEWGAAGGSTLPGGSDHSVQYKNGSAFAGGNDLTFHPTNNIFSVKHTVIVKGQGNGNPAGRLILNCEQDSHAITLEGPAHAGGANYTLKFPSSAPANNQVLEYENSTNNLRWINTPSGSGSPASPANSIQFNNAGAFGGSGDLKYDNSTKILTVGDQDVNRGIVSIAGGSSGAGELRLGDPGTSGGTVTLKGGNDHAASYTIKLPDDGPSANNKILESDASGNLTWISTPTGGGISFSGSTANGIATYSNSTTAAVSTVFTVSGNKLSAPSGTLANPSIEVGAVGGLYAASGGILLAHSGADAIGVSSSSIVNYKLTQLNSGLKFGSSGDTLDSYEEGSWTPTMFGAGSPTVTATGQYVKIGRNVTVWFSLICSAGDTLAVARISGLPFNGQGASVYGHNGGASLSVNTGNSNNVIYVTGTSGGATTLDLKVFTSGTDYQYAVGYWPNSQGNFTVRGTYTYKSQS